ncbi:MAG: small multi-drug export protein [Oscillospiraceae bacterium]|nr:small multi-drug export protein [Oscillospiraceae bacterium]
MKYLMVFLISMLPIVELRGAIPIGLSMSELSPFWVVLLSVIGNLLPVPFLILFGGMILRWLAKFPRLGKPFRWILQLGEKKVAKMNKTLFLGLFLFVAIPLPGTGAWTGSLAAITLQRNFKQAFPPIALGVLCSGAIILAIYYFAYGVFEVLF